MDWRQLWEICSAPDNVPIVGLIPLLFFYIYLAWKQARANDELIGQLETNPAMAKTHHRKSWPFRPGWQKEIHVWPFLLRIEFLAAMIVTIILMVWSITLNAPLEEPANPNLTMNPAKAPWYFLGLQEMLVYFDPWIAGVVMPTLIILGLMVIPYIDTNPLGAGYYTWKQRKFEIGTFLFGFIILWVSMITIGGFLVHALYRRYNAKNYQRKSLLQYSILMVFFLTMIGLPIKMLLRLMFHIKYVWITPWFNV